MWEINNNNQIITFLLSLCLGAICCAIYDIVRALRKVCLNSLLAITVGDILLWVFYALLTFIFLIARTNGEIRGYVLICELFGFILFRISVSKFLYSFLKFLFEGINAVIQKINKILGAFYIKIEHFTYKAVKFIIKILKRVKKLLKNAIQLLYTDKNIVHMEKAINETKTET